MSAHLNPGREKGVFFVRTKEERRKEARWRRRRKGGRAKNNGFLRDSLVR